MLLLFALQKHLELKAKYVVMKYINQTYIFYTTTVSILSSQWR